MKFAKDIQEDIQNGYSNASIQTKAEVKGEALGPLMAGCRAACALLSSLFVACGRMEKIELRKLFLHLQQVAPVWPFVWRLPEAPGRAKGERPNV